MDTFHIYYYCGSEILAKEVKEFKSVELAVSYVRSLEDMFVVKGKTSTHVIYKDKLTNIKISNRGPVEILK